MPRRNVIEVIVSGVDEASTPLGKAANSIKTLGNIATAAGAAVVAGMGAAAAGIAKLTVDAAKVEGVSRAFEGITQDIEGGSDAMLKALQQSSGGMIEQADLMQSFNKAAQLVSVDFAKRLPDAMGALGKVAAATGQDMGFLMDSLVTGVGRLSPMILDNLSIQVDAVAANEAYAKSIGKTTSQLTKQEQQVALMNQVVEKLAENTAAMPDITDTAAAKMEQFKVALKDAGLEIGTAFLPILESLVNTALPLLQQALPRIIESLQLVADVLGAVFSAAPADFPWEDVFPERIAEIAYIIAEAVENLTAMFAEYGGVLSFVQAFLGETLSLLTGLNSEAFDTVDTFYALADAFGVPAEQIMPLINNITAFGDKVREILEPIITFIAGNFQLSDVLMALGIILAATVLPALAAVASTVATLIATFTALVTVIAFLRENWETAWNTILMLNAIVQASVDAWVNSMVEQFFVLIAAVESLGGPFENFGSTVQGVFSAIGGAIDSVVGKVKDFVNSLKNIELPSFLKPGSPTPFELGLRGIGSAMDDLSTAKIPRMSRALTGGDTSNTYNFNQTVNTAATVPTVAQDFQTMAAMSGAAI